MPELLKGLPGLFDLRGWFRGVFSNDPHPVFQFIRYGIAGVAAMAANVLFFALSEWLLFPIEKAGEADVLAFPRTWGELGPWVQEVGSNDRVLNYLKCNVVAFLMANVVAYLLNFKWVFEGGRHSRAVEITLFFVVSFISFVIGTAIAGMLVGSFGLNEYVAKMGDVVSAILINYVCRKFLIFKG